MVFTSRVTAKLLSDFDVHTFGFRVVSITETVLVIHSLYADVRVQVIPKSTADLLFSVINIFFFLRRGKWIYDIIHFTKALNG